MLTFTVVVMGTDMATNYIRISNMSCCDYCLQNGAFVEAVIMRYDSRLGTLGGKPRPGGLRSTLCISSQVLFCFPIALLNNI